jgi:hypothetical protein
VRKLDDRRLRAVEKSVAVTEPSVRSSEAVGELDGAGNRSAILRKTLHHFRRREQDAFVISTALGLAAVERAAVTDRDENVLQWCPPRMVRMDITGDDRPDAARLGKIAQACIAARVATLVRTLELDEEALAAECAASRAAAFGLRTATRACATGEADEPVVQLLEQTLIQCGIRRGLGFSPDRPCAACAAVISRQRFA